jgi:hypothetical protein
MGAGRHRVETKDVDVPFGALARLAQEQEPRVRRGAAGSGGGLGKREMAPTGKNRIMIFGPKDDGSYVVEFRTAAGEALAISIPCGEAAVIRHFQKRMPPC